MCDYKIYCHIKNIKDMLVWIIQHNRDTTQIYILHKEATFGTVTIYKGQLLRNIKIDES